jgi:hypothetical protein
MSIAATRIYRNLADFVHEPTYMCFFPPIPLSPALTVIDDL